MAFGDQRHQIDHQTPLDLHLTPPPDRAEKGAIRL
jgi:hypothetical protein